MSKKILLIDDDPTVIKIMQSFLQAHDYTVAFANDGEQGLVKAAEFKPDLIVLDIQMPKMNGYTFVFEVKKQLDGQLIPIIVMTAKEGMAEIFKIEGVKDYLVKPVSPEKLLQAIQNYVK